MSDPEGLAEIGQIAVVAKDVDRARAFYRDTLGMKHLFDAPPHLAFFDCKGIRLMLTLADKPELERLSSILYFRVKDIDAMHKTLAGRGVRFEEKPHLVAAMPAYDLWMGSFRDSEGNLLALMSEVPK
jgi:methylmalonyl-CoA/ethylmalonyl-CoA epimerase